VDELTGGELRARQSDFLHYLFVLLLGASGVISYLRNGHISASFL
jgi:hypothetical protein